MRVKEAIKALAKDFARWGEDAPDAPRLIAEGVQSMGVQFGSY